MNTELALVPQYIIQRGNRTLENILSVVAGVLFLSLLAQVAIPLPWTPIPITGQTFGVVLIALIWGKKRGVSTILSYLSLGAFGLPIFAMGRSGLSLGPREGYLIGMVVATYWMGTLSDKGWTKTWWRTYLTAFSGSLIIFSFGVLGLSFFIPARDLLTAGVLPFLPGDFIKTLLATSIAFQTQQSLEKKI